MWRHLQSYSGIPRFLAAPAAKANRGKHIAKALRARSDTGCIVPARTSDLATDLWTWQPAPLRLRFGGHNPDRAAWKGSKLFRGLSRRCFFFLIRGKTCRDSAPSDEMRVRLLLLQTDTTPQTVSFSPRSLSQWLAASPLLIPQNPGQMSPSLGGRWAQSPLDHPRTPPPPRHQFLCCTAALAALQTCCWV